MGILHTKKKKEINKYRGNGNYFQMFYQIRLDTERILASQTPTHSDPVKECTLSKCGTTSQMRPTCIGLEKALLLSPILFL